MKITKRNRPDDWDKIKPETTPALGKMGKKSIPDNIFQAGVEAGADAILEAQARNGKVVLGIPPQGKIGCRTFDIVSSDRILDWQGHRATESCKVEIIRLHSGQSPEATFETLIHEAMHIANYLYGPDDLSEKDINLYSESLTQFLLSLGLEPDFSKIPEEKL